MKNVEPEIFTLANFEGPLDFLFHLIQKSEIEIYDIKIQEITQQYADKLTAYLEPNIDQGAEFVGTAAALLWLKSKTLLPKHEQVEAGEEESDPRFEIIHQLLDYCRFKQAAKDLNQLETHQGQRYLRGNNALPDIKKNLGIEHLSLTDLATLFKGIMAKAVAQRGHIHEESWKVSDKIKAIRILLKDQQQIDFDLLFSPALAREELIVTFLAVLELMKMGELRVIKDLVNNKVVILP